MGRDDGQGGAQHEAVALQRHQGLRQHFLADAAHFLAQLAEAVHAAEEHDQHQDAPAAGDVAQYRARWTFRSKHIARPCRAAGQGGPQ